MTRSELVTVRCVGPGGCGKWLLKYDKATGDPVKRNGRNNVYRQPDIETGDAAIVLDDGTDQMTGGYWFLMCCGNRYKIPKGFADRPK